MPSLDVTRYVPPTSPNAPTVHLFVVFEAGECTERMVRDDFRGGSVAAVASPAEAHLREGTRLQATESSPATVGHHRFGMRAAETQIEHECAGRRSELDEAERAERRARLELRSPLTFVERSRVALSGGVLTKEGEGKQDESGADNWTTGHGGLEGEWSVGCSTLPRRGRPAPKVITSTSA